MNGLSLVARALHAAQAAEDAQEAQMAADEGHALPSDAEEAHREAARAFLELSRTASTQHLFHHGAALKAKTMKVREMLEGRAA